MAGRRPKSLLGTHLFLKGRVYVWRREDPLTGKPIKRSTRSRSLEVALRVAAEFEEEWERRKAGLPNLDGWKKDLAALAEEWLAHQEREARASRPVIEAKRFRIGRALRELGLRTPADLADVARLHDRVMALEGKRVGRVIASRTNLRAAWQEPLKQLSAWLAENGRCLDRDPLASWKPIARGVRASKRRALMPDEMARSLQAADWLDVIHVVVGGVGTRPWVPPYTLHLPSTYGPHRTAGSRSLATQSPRRAAGTDAPHARPVHATTLASRASAGQGQATTRNASSQPRTGGPVAERTRPACQRGIA